MNVGSSKLPFLKLRLFKFPVYILELQFFTSRAYDRVRFPVYSIQVYLLRVRGSKRQYVYTLRSDCRSFPIVLFYIEANCTPRLTTPFNYSKSHRVNWSKVSHSDIEKYNDMVSLVYHLKSLTAHSLIVLSTKMFLILIYSQYLVFTLLTCSFHRFPTFSSSSSRKLAGWTDSTIYQSQENSQFFGISYGMMLVVHHQVYYFN